MKKIIIAATAVLMANAASAETCSVTSSEHQQCLDKAMTTADMIECNSAEAERQDKILNEVYKKIMKCVTKSQAEDIKKVQLAWLKLRDDNAKLLSSLSEGSMGGIGASAQNAEDLAFRVQYLKAVHDTVCEPED